MYKRQKLLLFTYNTQKDKEIIKKNQTNERKIEVF